MQVCGEPGCPVLTDDSYCLVHRPARVTGARWLKLKRAKLRESPVCEMCNHRLAVEVDHIVEIQDGGDPLDWYNLQSLCKRCHTDKTNARRTVRA